MLREVRVKMKRRRKAPGALRLRDLVLSAVQCSGTSQARDRSYGERREKSGSKAYIPWLGVLFPLLRAETG